jgi:Tol biopolymer transport system component
VKQKLHPLFSGGLALVIAVSVGLATASTASAAATGPDSATAPTGNWQTLNPGQGKWYSFYYAGDGSQIEIRLQVVPNDSLGFTVWTPDKIARWRMGLGPVPIGRSAQDPYAKDTLVWSGSFTAKGTYYIDVEPTSSQTGASYYLLSVSGTGVTLSQPTPTPTPKPAKSQTQAQTGPVAAPSGKLVFQTSYGGNFYSINADGTGLQRITNGIDPVWSPDGQQIAFVRWTDPRGVWVVNADGTNAHRIFDWSEARHPAWSSDGQQIVFSRQYGNVSSGGGGGGRRGPGRFGGRAPGGGGGGAGGGAWTLGIVNPVTGAFNEPQPTSDVSLVPDWSPDGTSIVYDGVDGLVVQSTDGKTSYALTQDAFDTSPVWSPDGKQVAFVYHQNDHWEIYVVNADGSNFRRLTDTPSRPDGTVASSVSPAWSPDGNYIAFYTDRAGKWQIWIMRSNGSGQKAMFGSALDGLTLDYAFVSERAISWTK